MMTDRLAYETLEKLTVARPVDRLAFIAALCRDKHVLDIGCLDETALIKRDTEHWLHGRIGQVARRVTGIDNSGRLPPEGLATGPNARIFKGDGGDPVLNHADDVDIIVAGEFIEHLESPLAFLRAMKQRFPGRELIVSTPNGVAFANALLATIGREAQHHDHLLSSTYKTLNTLCRRAGFAGWEIIPYRFYATEMLMQSRGVKKLAVRCVEAGVRIVERIFPLRSFGYILRIRL